jgi:hypothetical protein
MVVYVTHRLIEAARGLIQTACTSLGVFFSSMGLTISSSKSKVMLFSRKHERPPILIRIGSHVLPHTTTFKYLGVFFDCGLRWSAQTKYMKRRCLQRINLLKSVAGVSWGRIHLICFCYIGVSLAIFCNTVQFDMQEWPRHTCYCLNAFSIEHTNAPNGIYTQHGLGVLSGIPPLRCFILILDTL